jgi:predicted nuclease of predicted toxin-antitoxin system
MFPVGDARDGAADFGKLGVGVAGSACGMKILLDECVPWPMHRLLAGHDCTTAQRRGWGGIKNGELIRLAEGEFELFITADQNLRYQQNLAGRRLPILQLSTNDLRRIQAAAVQIQKAVAGIQSGEFQQLEIP